MSQSNQPINQITPSLNHPINIYSLNQIGRSNPPYSPALFPYRRRIDFCPLPPDTFPPPPHPCGLLPFLILLLSISCPALQWSTAYQQIVLQLRTSTPVVVSRLVHRGGNILPAAGGGGGVGGGAISAGSADRNPDGEDDDDDFIPVGWTGTPAELSMPAVSSEDDGRVREGCAAYVLWSVCVSQQRLRGLVVVS